MLGKNSSYISVLTDHDRLRNPSGDIDEKVQRSGSRLVSPELRHARSTSPSAAEDLGEVGGVQHQQTHTAENALVYPINDCVIDTCMGRMSPPCQHIVLAKTSSVRPCSG